MPPRMGTQSDGQPLAESREGGTGGRVDRGGGRGRGPKGGNDDHVDELNGKGNDQGNLLPAILAQVGNQGNVGNQNGNVVNQNVWENFRNVLVNGNQVCCSYKEFLACNPKEYDGKGGDVVLTRWIEKMEFMQDMSCCSIDQKVKYTAGSLVEFFPSHEMKKLETELWNHVMVGAGHASYTNRFHELARLVPYLVTLESRKIKRYVYGLAPQIRGIAAATEPNTMHKAVQIFGALIEKSVRNGSIKKRTRTGNAFATTTNPVGRANMGAWPKCTAYNSYHALRGPCRTCFNYNCPSHLAKDCKGVSRNVNPVNARNPTVRACYECRSTNHVTSSCPKLNRAHGLGGNCPNQVVANNRVRIPILEGKVLRVLGERPEEKVRLLMSTKTRDKKQKEIVVVRDFPGVFLDYLSRLPPLYEIEFWIELIPGAVPVAKSPYRLAPSELEELSRQLKELQDKGRIQDFDESKDHCLTLKNTSYPHQRYAIYNTLVNEEEQLVLAHYAVSIKEDTTITMEEYSRLEEERARKH
nr:reverse transcriptase domain-containing protein [Tanacetum cinerariifolium]